MPKNTSSTAGNIAKGLGVAAIAAAAAGTYYFMGEDGKKHRKAFTDLAKNAQAELTKKLKAVKSEGTKAYEQAAKEVMAKYKLAKNIKPEELAALGKQLKTTWEKVAKDVSKLGSKPTPQKKSKTKK